MLRNMSQIVQAAKERPSIRMVVASAADPTVLEAVIRGAKDNLAEPILVGDKDKIEGIAKEKGFSLSQCEIEDIKDPIEASRKAVQITSNGEAHLLMKGLVSSADLLREVLNKDYGLRKGGILSHVALFDLPLTEKLCILTDGGMCPYPDLNAKVAIIENAMEVMLKLGHEMPLIAPIAAVEVVNPDMPNTMDDAILTQMNRRGQIKGCIIDGPLGLDNAISIKAAEHKGIKSDVAGRADILLVPDIQVGNILYKSIAFIANLDTACVIAGAKAPIILTSRADDEQVKYLSIAFAVLCA